MRQDFATDKETMFHTALQRIFSVLNCKNRMEKIHGPLSNITAHECNSISLPVTPSAFRIKPKPEGSHKGTADFCKKYSEHYLASSDAEKAISSIPNSLQITLVFNTQNPCQLLDCPATSVWGHGLVRGYSCDAEQARPVLGEASQASAESRRICCWQQPIQPVYQVATDG